MPTCWIIAGPNGAGKTTFAMDFLPHIAKCTHFINADSIAAGLSPLAPEKELITASKLFLKEIKNSIAARKDFAFETTLSGRNYLKLIKQLQGDGWRVELVYLALPDVDASKSRVAERVNHGGHNIPAKDIERRFPRTLYNLLYHFSDLVDKCQCFLNTDSVPKIIFIQQGKSRTIIEPTLFALIEESARHGK